MDFSNVSADTSFPTKAKGKRKKNPFTLKSRKRFNPPLFAAKPNKRGKKGQRVKTAIADVAHPDRVPFLQPHMRATTARGNDGMSFMGSIG